MCLRPIFPNAFLSVWSIHWYKWGIKIAYYYCTAIYLSIVLCPSLVSVHYQGMYFIIFSLQTGILRFPGCMIGLDWPQIFRLYLLCSKKPSRLKLGSLKLNSIVHWRVSDCLFLCHFWINYVSGLDGI